MPGLHQPQIIHLLQLQPLLCHPILQACLVQNLTIQPVENPVNLCYAIYQASSMLTSVNVPTSAQKAKAKYVEIGTTLKNMNMRNMKPLTCQPSLIACYSKWTSFPWLPQTVTLEIQASAMLTQFASMLTTLNQTTTPPQGARCEVCGERVAFKYEERTVLSLCYMLHLCLQHTYYYECTNFLTDSQRQCMGKSNTGEILSLCYVGLIHQHASYRD